MLRKLWKGLDQKEINCRKINKQTKDNQNKTKGWNIKDIKYIYKS